MQPPVKHTIGDQTLWLSAQRTIFWEQEKALIVADLHLGKSGHFRKSGIGIPQTIFKEDMQRLLQLIQFFKPEKMIVVGDMFHSEANKELHLFSRWRKDVAWLKLLLVKGNHDILRDSWYQDNDITIYKDRLDIGSFSFQHDYIPGEASGDSYVFSGHIHPGVSIKGMAKQQLSFPCFHFTQQCCTLPAFSLFTGFIPIKKQQGQVVFAIVNNTLMAI